MMKVEKQEDNGQLILQVEGRLIGAYVAELETCWRSEREKDPGRAIAVDLKSVTCVDRAGRYLLLLMHTSGVRFVRAGMAVQDIVEQISDQPESKR
jgi:anti-anti-sigma regulatory factor